MPYSHRSRYQRLQQTLNRNIVQYNQSRFDHPLFHQAWYYNLPVNCVFKIPQMKSELEQQIIRKLNWDRFVFQFPPHLDIRELRIKTIYRVEKDILDQIVVHVPRPGRPSLYPKAITNRQRNSINAEWYAYRKHINLPSDLQKNFPLLYAIIHDQFICNVLNAKNAKQLAKMQKSLLTLLTRSTSLLVEMFNLVRTNVDPWRDQLETEDVIDLLARVRKYIEPFMDLHTDPRIPMLEDESKILKL